MNFIYQMFIKANLSRGTPVIRKSRTVTMRAVKRRTVFLRRKTLLRRRAEGSGPKKRILRTITDARIPTTRAKKRADTAGGSARTGNGLKNLTSGVTSRQRRTPLRRLIPLQRAQNRSFREVRSQTGCKRKRRRPGKRPKPQGRSSQRKRNIL